MSSNLIGTEPGKGLALLADITMKYRGGVISVEMLDLFAKGQLVPAPGVKLVASRDPLDALVSKIERGSYRGNWGGMSCRISCQKWLRSRTCRNGRHSTCSPSSCRSLT